MKQGNLKKKSRYQTPPQSKRESSKDANLSAKAWMMQEMRKTKAR